MQAIGSLERFDLLVGGLQRGACAFPMALALLKSLMVTHPPGPGISFSDKRNRVHNNPDLQCALEISLAGRLRIQAKQHRWKFKLKDESVRLGYVSVGLGLIGLTS